MKNKLVKRLAIVVLGVATLGASGCPQEAPQSFEKQNGFVSQKEFDEAKDAFDEIEGPQDGLGVHFNESSCAGCHGPTVKGGLTGGSGPVTELRAGHLENGQFIPAPGGTLITLQATNNATTEAAALSASENVRDRFITLSLFGDGFVECIPDEMLRRISNEQNARTNGRIKGLVRVVAISEAPGKTAVGRFGWASQHASLLSFAADAYKNEMGITSKLQPEDNTFLGQKVDDGVADPEDTGGTFGEDVEFFARFMRALSAPPRLIPADAKERKDVENGAKIFKNIGCNVCHLPDLVTAKAGAKVNGGSFTVPAALGNKRFHPYGDFLLHDIGTGPAILREGMPPETKNKIRTAALWGMGSRLANGEPLLHDGSAKTPEEAIQRHKNSAAQEADKFQKLSANDKARLLKFLRSL
ncbi:MAG: hypothetical protein JNK38_28005 [Acidobacteria bacterium]|nr:hypothetical protein [Acidobacteriota bacterium]